MTCLNGTGNTAVDNYRDIPRSNLNYFDCAMKHRSYSIYNSSSFCRVALCERHVNNYFDVISLTVVYRDIDPRKFYYERNMMLPQ